MLIGKIISISDIRVNIFRLEDVDVKIGDVLEAKVGDKSYEFEWPIFPPLASQLNNLYGLKTCYWFIKRSRGLQKK